MDNQEKRNILPQDLRRVALLLGFSGGAVDVYSHLRFHTLVATQTGNIVLMVAQIAEKQDNFLPRLTSIIVFSIGFVLGIAYKQRAQTPYWRIFAMMPMLIACLVLPFLPSDQLLFKIIALSFGTGLLMLTFTGSKIETVPYTIMMASGNYRRMLMSWYHYATSAAKNPQDKRDVVNYTIKAYHRRDHRISDYLNSVGIQTKKQKQSPYQAMRNRFKELFDDDDKTK